VALPKETVAIIYDPACRQGNTIPGHGALDIPVADQRVKAASAGVSHGPARNAFQKSPRNRRQVINSVWLRATTSRRPSGKLVEDLLMHVQRSDLHSLDVVHVVGLG
jgi:hypothetical protein